MDHREFLATAYGIAVTSPDPSNQNGALAVTRAGLIMATECNDFPPGFEMEEHEYMETGSTADLPMDARRQNKLDNIEHAERAVCYRSPHHELNHTMYCPWATCHPCGRGIVMSGFKRLVVHKERIEQTPARWIRDVTTANEKVGRKLEIVTVSGSIPTNVVIRVNGRYWSPKTLEYVD